MQHAILIQRIRPYLSLAILLVFGSAHAVLAQHTARIRLATFNTSLNRSRPGALCEELAAGKSQQARAVAEIIQRTRPQILLLNEFDFDEDQIGIHRFQQNFLAVSQRGQPPLTYPYVLSLPVNTGVPTGFDLDKNGRTSDAGDCFGFGQFPGQYGLVVLSMFPVQTGGVRTFRQFLWKTLAEAKRPVDPGTGQPFYSDAEWARLRLSSKSHWDVPVQCGDDVLHFLVCHPTPPAFDGPERRNKLRNYDEIRFWADYIDPQRSKGFVDDVGRRGGLPAGSRFVIAGDLNADPIDGASEDQAIQQLLNHERIRATTPASAGAVLAANKQGGINDSHQAPAKFDTSDFNDKSVGNLRVDYVLPSKIGFAVKEAAVFWPTEADLLQLVERASDHRLVWIDVELRRTTE